MQLNVTPADNPFRESLSDLQGLMEEEGIPYPGNKKASSYTLSSSPLSSAPSAIFDEPISWITYGVAPS